METEAHSRALLNISFGVPSKGALTPGPPHEVPSERVVPFLSPPLFTIQSLRYMIPPPHDYRYPSDINGPLWTEMPATGVFLNISSRFATKGALPRGPPQ